MDEEVCGGISREEAEALGFSIEESCEGDDEI